MFSVCNFYSLRHLAGLDDVIFLVRDLCSKIKGTVIVAANGINGTICGDQVEIENFTKAINAAICANIESKISACDFVPFSKMKVLKRAEVVSLRSDIDLDWSLVPENVEPTNWDKLIEDESTQLIDVRNSYECAIGTFVGAIDPKTQNFRDFKDFLRNALSAGELSKNKKTAICCTGGIRCEIAGVYMKNLGFEKVFQLRGGILKYLEETKAKNWLGDCFIFDDRVTLKKDLSPGVLRCIHCLQKIDNFEERRDITKGRVVCLECRNDKL